MVKMGSSNPVIRSFCNLSVHGGVPADASAATRWIAEHEMTAQLKWRRVDTLALALGFPRFVHYCVEPQAIIPVQRLLGVLF
jgi:hypothetical protein